MRKVRKMPSWLAELAEKNPTAYRRAISKGGRNSARSRAAAPRVPKLSEEEILAEIRREEDERGMRLAALARNDHLLPEEE